MATPPRNRGTAKARAPHSALARSVQLPLQDYLHTESVGGAVLAGAALLGLLWANSPWAVSYNTLWTTSIRVVVGDAAFQQDLRHLVNDGLMAIFFFVVGLEIKRELVEGMLSERSRATLPVAAALGGMLLPAAIYAVIVAGGEGANGWGVPMATDVAFAVAVLGMTSASRELKILLLALAIVDDIGAILVIAVFYTSEFSGMAAAGAGLAVLAIIGMQRAGFQHMGSYVPIAALFWFAVLESGVHATIAGVVLGALTPAHPLVPHPAFAGRIRRLGRGLEQATSDDDGERTEQLAAEVEESARQSESPLERAERLFHPWSSYAILPLFALANSGVALSGDALAEAVASPVSYGVLAGLVLGKPAGILLFAWMAVRSGVATLPDGISWRHVSAIGALAGIGFTVSLFITELAFSDDTLTTAAKIAIFAASLLAAGLGWLLTRRAS
ncbi:MAG: Na+/H+ antiporter NhaA [Vicinamibacterales bacterium]